MKYGKNKSVFKSIMNSPVTLFVVFCLFVFLVKSTLNLHNKSLATAGRLEEAQASLNKLQKRSDELTQKVAYLSTDGGIESEIRTRFRASQNDESVAVIVGDTEPRGNIGGAATSTENRTWWAGILGQVGI